jgi:hypothetical protein
MMERRTDVKSVKTAGSMRISQGVASGRPETRVNMLVA